MKIHLMLATAAAIPSIDAAIFPDGGTTAFDKRVGFREGQDWPEGKVDTAHGRLNLAVEADGIGRQFLRLFPMIDRVDIAGERITPAWTFTKGMVDRSEGIQVTIVFTCANPALELRSVWQAHKGPGPVHVSMLIVNILLHQRSW